VIISPDFEFLKEYCKIKKINYSSPEHIINESRIQKRIQKEIDKTNEHLDQPKKIKKFKLVADVWTPDSEELSPTLKLKRKFLKEKYKKKMEEIYAEKNQLE
jgi:long-chain acyl-CoA synthetase